MLDLEPLAARKPGTLSGGQRRRLGLGHPHDAARHLTS